VMYLNCIWDSSIMTRAAAGISRRAKVCALAI
jgi:hypothetical protein